MNLSHFIFQAFTFSKFVSLIKPMVNIIAKNIEAAIVPKLSPPFSIGLVRRSPKVAPNGLVKTNAIQNKTILEIFVQRSGLSFIHFQLP